MKSGKIILISTLIALSLRFFIIEDYRVISDSMSPTLLPGDLVFISKAAYSLYLPFSNYEWFHLNRPQPFEIVAFNLPTSNQDSFVKRVVAVAGDRVEIKKGILKINGKGPAYDRDTSNTYFENWGSKRYRVIWNSDKILDYGPVDVPANHFFALGDNRENSLDSRTWGPIPYTCLKGKVGLVWASLDSSGSFRVNRIGTWIQ